jgi:hypothetical protein
MSEIVVVGIFGFDLVKSVNINNLYSTKDRISITT